MVVLLAVAAGRGAPAPAGQPTKPFFISKFRPVPLDPLNDRFCWGSDSQLFYVHLHPSGRFIYLLNLSTNQSELITKGTSPYFRPLATVPGTSLNFDSLYFLRDLGYSIDKELWRYDRFFTGGTQGEAKFSSAILRIAGDIFLSPEDDRLLAYSYGGSRAEGFFQQIRATRVKRYDDASFETAVLYSRDLGGEMPTISGWVDSETLVCFIRNEPYLLKVDFSFVLGSEVETANHYPDDNSGKLIRGLAGRNEVKLAASNFAPDGTSYLVLSSQTRSIVQKRLDGSEVRRTELPSEVRVLPRDPELGSFNEYPPKFSRDGRHIAFLGFVDNVGTVYVADVN
jgi:hypothetical protein